MTTTISTSSTISLGHDTVKHAHVRIFKGSEHHFP